MYKYENELVVDPAVLANSGDEDYQSAGFDTSTASLTSSIQKYALENGRRYHTYFGNEKNPMPTDETEQNRLDLHHEVMRQILRGKLFLAPIKDPQRILDVGTGTGIWAIDVADMYPAAEVIGTDLSPIQPTWVPANCRFEIDDMEKDWGYQEDTFDFIHARNISQAITNWGPVMDNMYRCTKPGGWVELAEIGMEVLSDDHTAGANFKKFVDQLNKAMSMINRPQPTGEMLRKRMLDAGYVDVEVRQYKQPFGPWPKDPRMKQIGAMVMITSETGGEAYGLAAFTRILGMSEDEARKLIKDCSNDIRNKNMHAYTPYYVVYGQKRAH